MDHFWSPRIEFQCPLEKLYSTPLQKHASYACFCFTTIYYCYHYYYSLSGRSYLHTGYLMTTRGRLITLLLLLFAAAVVVAPCEFYTVPPPPVCECIECFRRRATADLHRRWRALSGIGNDGACTHTYVTLARLIRWLSHRSSPTTVLHALFKDPVSRFKGPGGCNRRGALISLGGFLFFYHRTRRGTTLLPWIIDSTKWVKPIFPLFYYNQNLNTNKYLPRPYVWYDVTLWKRERMSAIVSSFSSPLSYVLHTPLVLFLSLCFHNY